MPFAPRPGAARPKNGNLYVYSPIAIGEIDSLLGGSRNMLATEGHGCVLLYQDGVLARGFQSDVKWEYIANGRARG